MNHNLYDSNVEHCEGEVIYTPAVQQNGISAWLTANSCNAILRNTQIEAQHNRCLAYLTQEALTYSGMLSSAEEKLNRIAPIGREEYRKIQQAFTNNVVSRIKRW